MKSATLEKVEPVMVADRTGTDIFISHSRHDLHFVPLLEALLDLHDHRSSAWLAEADGDGRLDPEVERAIREADAVLVVLNERSVLPRGITAEIAAFHGSKPEAPVVPLLLEPVDLDRISPGLAQFPSIDFSVCMLTGFQKLFATFGNQFLSKDELRDRRTFRLDRREEPERRRSTVQQRMQMGLLLGYCRVTERSVFEKQGVSLKELTALKTTLQDEARRYEYFDRADGRPVEPLEALDRAVLAVWHSMGDRHEQEVVKVLRAIAEEVCDLHTIRMADRRTTERRRRR